MCKSLSIKIPLFGLIIFTILGNLKIIINKKSRNSNIKTLISLMVEQETSNFS